MRMSAWGAWCLVGVLVLKPGVADAQEAIVSGTVTDATGGVLPGVSVRAQNEATGNTFETVTDDSGAYRIPVRVGRYVIVAELSGFSAARREAELLVGQTAVIDLQLSLTGLAESVTVTGEAPLLDTSSSTFRGNIDSRQMENLPVQGRDWMALALLAPGNRSNAVQQSGAPMSDASVAQNFQINVDGQQVTNLIILTGAFGNPKFSRDAVAEFEFVANRFDATQGRSTAVQVNAITKSGTNTFAGSFGSYFRDDSFNAADHVVGRVLRYSDQQFSTTFGGPIRRDRVHFFGNYEYEREPQTFTYTTPYPRFNFDQTGTRREHTGGGRVDVQFSPTTRLAVRANAWQNHFPFGSGSGALSSATQTPAAAIRTIREMQEVHATLTQVFSNRALNELKVGFASYGWDFSSVAQTTWPPGLQTPPQIREGHGTPRIALRGLIIGQNNQFSPQAFDQNTYSLRDDFTYSFTARGRHDMRIGGEFLYFPIWNFFCNLCFANVDADRSPHPANLESLFPDLLDARTWNLAPLSPITYRISQGVGNFVFNTNRQVVAGWLQDDWAATSRLTLNLGVRYDLMLNAFVNDVELGPFLPGNRPDDTNNVAPRLGFVYRLNDRTALRGGFGQFYGDIQNLHFMKIFSQSLVIEVENDGRADFAANPFNGPMPSYEQALANVCTPANPVRPGCIRRALGRGVYAPNAVVVYSYQSSVGLQRQLGSTMAVSADYLFTGGRREPVDRNINLTYDPATGANHPFREINRRQHPDWGVLNVTFNEGRSNMHALELTFTKRFSQRWQVAANYMLSGRWNATSPPPVDFATAPDMGGEYTLAAGDQRHRAVMNAIWDVGRGLQLSGIYFYGSGERFVTTWGPDLRDTASPTVEARLRPDGTIVARNNFVGEPIHRVDLRLQQRIPLGGRVRLDGIAEVFNLFDRANFGSYTTQEVSPAYGRPTLNQNIAYAPRTLQLGFRVGF
jgi:hypothetical protein